MGQEKFVQNLFIALHRNEPSHHGTSERMHDLFEVAVCFI